MPTYSRISVAVSPAEEMEIKKKAKENNLSLSAYCKDKILGEQEQPLSRATIESEIDKLKSSIDRLNNNMMTLSQILLEQSLLNAELSNQFLGLALSGNESKQLEIYNLAKNKADERIKLYFD